MKTKNVIWLCRLMVMGLVSIITISCKKEKEQEPGQPPFLTTGEVYSVKPTSATCGGNITSNGGATVTSRGICWDTIQNPTIDDNKTMDGTGTGTFESALTGLKATTTYYVKAYATNSIATSYGNELSFKTYTDTLPDIDGNVYNTMTIGTQTWMAENLKTTKYNDKTVIPLVTDKSAWAALSTSGRCWYNNDAETYKSIYGGLYNWYVVDAASNGGKNVCPTGWHVPTDTEWTTLTTFLGGENVAGGKMKETSTARWQSPNIGATNESGFTAIPGGGRYYDGTFSSIGSIGCWWSSTELLATTARGRYLYYDYILIYRGSGSKLDGFSVRCVKD